MSRPNCPYYCGCRSRTPLPPRLPLRRWRRRSSPCRSRKCGNCKNKQLKIINDRETDTETHRETDRLSLPYTPITCCLKLLLSVTEWRVGSFSPLVIYSISLLSLSLAPLSPSAPLFLPPPSLLFPVVQDVSLLSVKSSHSLT